MKIVNLNHRSKMLFSVKDKLDDADYWVDYLHKHLYVGVEHELEWRHSLSDSEIRSIFGVPHTGYHVYRSCSGCKLRSKCWNTGTSNPELKEWFCHSMFRDNMIVAVQTDGSIDGLEFLYHTGTMTTTEFMDRLIIDKLQEYFRVTRRAGIHTHLIVPYYKRDIPYVILENTYNLFRYYYCGLAWLTGTTRNYILRGGYASFTSYNIPLNRVNGRDAFNIENTVINTEKNKVTELNVELRLFDTSLNVEHIALCRFVSKLLMLRGAEISKYGTLTLTNNTVWRKRKKAIRRLNHHYDLNPSYFLREKREEIVELLSTMKNTAEELNIELADLMSPVEKQIMEKFIEYPIWKSRQYRQKYSKKKKKRVEEALLFLVKTKSVFAPSRKQYYNKISRKLEITPNYTRNLLSKIGAKWDGKIQTFVLERTGV